MQRRGVKQQFAWVLFKIKYLPFHEAVSNLRKLEEKGFPGASSAAVEGGRTGEAIKVHANPTSSGFSWAVTRRSRVHGHLAEGKRVLQPHLPWLKLGVQTAPRGDAGLQTGSAVMQRVCPVGSEMIFPKLLLGQEKKSLSKVDIEAVP